MSSFKFRFALLTSAFLLLLSLPLGADTFKISTVSPDGSAWMKDLRATLKMLNGLTDGRVSFRIYPGGVMGDDRAVLRKMRARQLHGGIFQTGSLENISSGVQLYNLPMVFRDFDEVTAVRRELDSLLIEDLEKGGMTVFGFVGLGFANAMSSKSGTSITDAQGLKVWAPKGDAGVVRLFSAFDIVPIPLSLVDVLAGLQTGLIDTVAAPPISAIVLQWHTQLDYVLDLPFMYVYSVFAVDSKRFGTLSLEDQILTRQTLGKLCQRIEEKNYADQDNALRALQAQGIKILKPSAEEVAEWRTAANGASTAWVERDILNKTHVQRLHGALAEYRAASPR